MRGAFAATLTELAAKDDRIVLLTADLGFMALEAFAERHPNRFLNVGVSEQNMIGVATGLAEAGFIPFVYSIVTFATLRGYEFIRNGPVMHQLPVRIVGVGGGVEYAHAGTTHHGLEDLAVMCAQPMLTVIAPADPDQTRTALEATWSIPGPIYYRIGKNDKLRIVGLGGRFVFGSVELVAEGDDVLILTTGAIASEAVTAAEMLKNEGVGCAVGVVATLNPPPVDALDQLLRKHAIVITLEAHYRRGGLGSIVSEAVAARHSHCRVLRVGIDNSIGVPCGSQEFLQRRYGLDASSVVAVALSALRTQALE